MLLFFKFLFLYKNLDDVVDMVDGVRSIKLVKYEFFIYNFINKMKYVIGFIYLIVMIEGLFNKELKECLIVNRFINLQGGKNNNMVLDEYVEFLNRDSKIVCFGF